MNNKMNSTKFWNIFAVVTLLIALF
ncbi:hypothetical protein LCGC14_2516470, partial [marine sediment metagenome]